MGFGEVVHRVEDTGSYTLCLVFFLLFSLLEYSANLHAYVEACCGGGQDGRLGPFCLAGSRYIA